MLHKTFAPANISCIFQIHQGKTSSTTGSTGVGFTLNKGVSVGVEESRKTEMSFNGKLINFPTVNSVINKLCSSKHIKVRITSDFSLGCGFGISGASALATSYALNDLLHLKKSRLELAKIAHIAEVENKTGLGDVVNQYFRGFLLKTVSSFKFKVQKMPLENVYVYCKSFGPLETEKVLSDIKMIERINKAGKQAIGEVQHLSSLRAKQNYFNTTKLFADIIAISKQFAIESGLLTSLQVMKKIEHIESLGGEASMIMLGNGVFSNIPFEGAMKYVIS